MPIQIFSKTDNFKPPAKFVMAKGGKSFFGHDGGVLPLFEMATPPKAKIDLILTLAKKDKFFPFPDFPHKHLHLISPLRFGNGGAEIQYTYLSKIPTILSMNDIEEWDHEISDDLPQIYGSLIPMNVKEAAQFAVTTIFPQVEFSEKNHLLDPGNTIVICPRGVPISPSCWEIIYTCSNKHCESFGRTRSCKAFAVVPLSKNLFENIPVSFGEYTEQITLYWGITKCCETIVSGNRF